MRASQRMPRLLSLGRQAVCDSPPPVKRVRRTALSSIGLIRNALITSPSSSSSCRTLPAPDIVDAGCSDRQTVRFFIRAQSDAAKAEHWCVRDHAGGLVESGECRARSYERGCVVRSQSATRLAFALRDRPRQRSLGAPLIHHLLSSRERLTYVIGRQAAWAMVNGRLVGRLTKKSKRYCVRAFVNTIPG